MSLRAPLAKALNHGAAHDGVHHWVVQRVTALALAPLAVWLVWQLLSLPDVGYVTVTAWIEHSWNAVLLSLMVLLASWHAWLGVQIVVEDYVHGFLPKTSVLLLSTFVHALIAASGIFAVLRIALRSAR
jgi:succinate dehydrogenase / fumarate reductase, membrane anchor subunit